MVAFVRLTVLTYISVFLGNITPSHAVDQITTTGENVMFLKAGNGAVHICNGYTKEGMVYKATKSDMSKMQDVKGQKNTAKVRTASGDLPIVYIVCDIDNSHTDVGITTDGYPMEVTGGESLEHLTRIQYPCGDDASLMSKFESWKSDVTKVIGRSFRTRLTTQYDFNKIVFIIIIVIVLMIVLILIGLIIALIVKQRRRKALKAMMAAGGTEAGVAMGDLYGRSAASVYRSVRGAYGRTDRTYEEIPIQ